MSRQSLKTIVVSVILALAVLLQPLCPMFEHIAQVRAQSNTDSSVPGEVTAPCYQVHLPVIASASGAIGSAADPAIAQEQNAANELGPDFAIISPGEGWTISGMTFFAVQPAPLDSISSVSFKTGATDLGTDATPADGFKVFLNASTLPAGPLQLTAMASNPCGQTTKTITVNNVPNPPSNATVGAQGGVLASEIGSIITVPPDAVPAGTVISVTEKSQEQITAETGIDWAATGVTFLGAQTISSTAPFSRPLGVASAGFGNRVQPGQAVVNYNIVPDADGDGIDELVVVNMASVAPNNDVIADPVPQILLGSVQTVSGTVASTAPLAFAAATGLQGPPGTMLVTEGSGFNSSSVLGNVAIFRSAVSGQTVLVPANVEENEDGSGQTLRVLIPILPTGAATLTLRNQSTGDVSDPLEVIVTAPAALSQPASELVDAFFVTYLAFVETLTAPTPETQANRQTMIDQATKMHTAFQQAKDDPSPAVQQLIMEVAIIIDGSGVLVSAEQANLVMGAVANRCLTDHEKNQLILFSNIVGAIGGLGCFLFASGIGAALCGFGTVVVIAIHQYTIAETPDCSPPPTTCQPTFSINIQFCIFCIINNGMGSAPPPGGNGCGDASAPPPPPSANTNALNVQAAGFFDQQPRRIVVKVLSSGLPTPFTGVTDAGGYFFIPLIPQGEPFKAVAIDTLTGQTRTFEGIGSHTGESVFMFFDFFSETNGTVGSIAWDGGGDGVSWHNALNWSTDRLPGITDTVTIDLPSNITVIHSQGNTSIVSLRSQEAIVLSGGVLSIDSASEIDRGFTVSGGMLSGAGVLTATGTLTWTGGTMSGGGRTVAGGGLVMTGTQNKLLSGRSLDNVATATWNSGGRLDLANGGVFTNLPGATLSTESNGIFLQFGSDGAFVNNGVVNVQTGTLDILNSSPSSSLASSGTFNVASGATLQYRGGTNNFTGTAGFSGTGTLLVTGTPPGVLNFNGVHTVTVPITLTGDGVIAGAGDLIVNSPFAWTGGAMSGSGRTIAKGGLTISGTADKSLSGRTLENAAGTIWRDNGHIWASGGGGGVFNNLLGATFEAQNDAVFIGSNATLNNAGTFIKSGGSGTTRIDGVFNNSAAVQIQSGTLHLRGGGSSSGAFNFAAGTTFHVDSAYTFAPNSVVAGAGQMRFSSAAVTVAGNYTISNTSISGGSVNFNSINPVTIPNLNLTGGVLGGSSDVIVTNVISWTNGTMSGSGRTIANGTLQLPVSGGKSLDGRTFVNNGTATWSGTGINRIHGHNGATIMNSAGATFDIVSDGELLFGSGERPTFVNEGLFTKSGGSSSTAVLFNFTNRGTVEAQSGSLSFTFYAVYSQTTGATLLNGGSFATSGGAKFNLEGGSLVGVGTITGNVVNNGGQVNPGGVGAAGVLTITGNYTQAMPATLNIELGGLTAGTQYDRLAITGSATLDGVLNVSLVNGFTPSSGNSFQVLTYGSRTGAFATLNCNGFTCTLTYNPTNLTLVAP